MATFLNDEKSRKVIGESASLRGEISSKGKNNFLPSIFEEKQDDKIQDFCQALQINQEYQDDGIEGSVRSGFFGSDAHRETIPQRLRSRSGTVNLGTLNRRLSGSSSESGSSRALRQNSAFAWGNRSKSGILGGYGSLGYGHRKNYSPDVNMMHEEHVPEVIDLNNPEQVKNIAKRFFKEELNMDLSDPVLTKTDDLIARLRWKAEKKFSYDELWHRRRNSLEYTDWLTQGEIAHPSASVFPRSQLSINRNSCKGFNEKLKPFPQLKSKYFEVYYTKPNTNGKSKIENENLATYFGAKSEKTREYSTPDQRRCKEIKHRFYLRQTKWL